MTDRPLVPARDYLQDAVSLARRLLGCRLIHETPEGRCGGVIVETEAYMGLSDDAAHSYRGRPDGRVNVQYGPGGAAYIYLIYGIHSCFNVVANVAGVPEAVLVRALEPDVGLERMRLRRPKAKTDLQLCAGPGRLCAALGITRAQYGLDLRGGTLYIEDRAAEPPIEASLRIGVGYAKECRMKPWRFTVRDNPYVSVPAGKEKQYDGI